MWANATHCITVLEAPSAPIGNPAGRRTCRTQLGEFAAQSAMPVPIDATHGETRATQPNSRPEIALIEHMQCRYGDRKR